MAENEKTCTFLDSLLPLKSCTDPAQMNLVIGAIRDIICAPCTMLADDGTLPEDFACLWLDNDGNYPDPENCPVLQVVVGCSIYIAPNKPADCDLGTCPSTPGTGTDWQQIGSPNSGAFTRAILITHTTLDQAHVVMTAFQAAVFTIVELQESGSGTYNNATGRWTCAASGWYRIFMRTPAAVRFTSGAVPAVYNGAVLPFMVLDGITAFQNFFADNGFGGNIEFTSVPQESGGDINFISTLYINAGQTLDFGGIGISTTPANVTHWHITAGIYNNSTLIIERLI